MKAIIIDEFGDLNNIKIGNIPIPEPEPYEVQIKVDHASINPVDWKIAAGLLRERMPYELPITLGWDVAGTITKVGEHTSYYQLDEKVFAYARKEMIHDGTLAEYICLNEKNIAYAPITLSFKEAAAIPLAGLTAWQALVDTAQMKEHDSILIHAGAGGVGSMAIQFAKQYGAKIFTTASSENHEYVKKLGADIAIDYHKEDFVHVIKSHCPEGVDIVFDTIGGNTLDASLNVIKKGGHLVSILQQLSDDIISKYKIKASYVFVRPDGEQLRMISDLFENQKIIVPEIHAFPFEKSKEALEILKKGHTRGKIVINVSNSSS